MINGKKSVVLQKMQNYWMVKLFLDLHYISTSTVSPGQQQALKKVHWFTGYMSVFIKDVVHWMMLSVFTEMLPVTSSPTTVILFLIPLLLDQVTGDNIAQESEHYSRSYVPHSSCHTEYDHVSVVKQGQQTSLRFLQVSFNITLICRLQMLRNIILVDVLSWFSTHSLF